MFGAHRCGGRRVIRTSLAGAVLFGVALSGVSGCAMPRSLGSGGSPSAPPTAAAPPRAPVPAPPDAPPGPGALQDVDWTTLTDAATGISVKLAGPAQHQSKPFSTPDGKSTIAQVYATTFGSGNEEQLYISGVGRALTSTELAGLFQKQAKEQSGTITSSTPITVHGYQGVDMRMSVLDGGQQVTLFIHAVCTPKNMVQLLTEAPSSDPTASSVHDHSVNAMIIP
jgi:hypothetical protein